MGYALRGVGTPPPTGSLGTRRDGAPPDGVIRRATRFLLPRLTARGAVLRDLRSQLSALSYPLCLQRRATKLHFPRLTQLRLRATVGKGTRRDGVRFAGRRDAAPYRVLGNAAGWGTAGRRDTPCYQISSPSANGARRRATGSPLSAIRSQLSALSSAPCYKVTFSPVDAAEAACYLLATSH